MLGHMVYFTLKDRSPAAIEKMLTACRTYLTGHSGLVFFAVGTLVPDLKRPVNQLDFDIALQTVFESLLPTTPTRSTRGTSSSSTKTRRAGSGCGCLMRTSPESQPSITFPLRLRRGSGFSRAAGTGGSASSFGGTRPVSASR